MSATDILIMGNLANQDRRAADAVIRSKNEDIESLMDSAQKLTQKLHEAQAALAANEAVLRNLQGQLNSERCHAAGLTMQLEGFKMKHADSALMTASGKTFASGKMKTIGRQLYEIGFDKYAMSIGIVNPAAHRAD